MSDLMLRWFIKGPLSETGVVGVEVGGAYKLDQDYKCDQVYMRLKTAVSGSGVTIDINDDGVSIFNYQPAIVNSQEKVWTTVKSDILQKDSTITLDIDVVSATRPCDDLTVILFLNKV